MSGLSSLEICTGAGGQALGLEEAGFVHDGLVELDPHACQTIRINRPKWNMAEGDVRAYSGKPFQGIDLLAGGVPCPPFSKAGKQLGSSDERDLFPEALRLVDEARPKAVMIENVRGLLDGIFTDYRGKISLQLKKLGYVSDWRVLNASDYGVPQLRPRSILIAIQKGGSDYFDWPEKQKAPPLTVGNVLFDLMASNGWEGAEEWRLLANRIAPTIVGGSKKHGGPDLGPTRAKKAWEQLFVNGHGLGDAPPLPGFIGLPKLTVRMVARLQGFPDDWIFYGKKTPAYRQVGNAFPPPVAKSVGLALRQALEQMGKTYPVKKAI